MDKIKTDNFKEISRRVFQMESASIYTLIDAIDYNIFKKTADLLLNCSGKIITSGCGTSGIVAKKVAHSLNCIMRPALFLTPSDAVHGGLGVVTANDVIVLFSKGGKTAELIKMIPSLKQMNATIIVVSENRLSKMVGEADIFIEIPASQEPESFNMLATASTLTTIAYFDAIVIFMKEWSGYKKENFLLVHPGGAVGERLLDETSTH